MAVDITKLTTDQRAVIDKIINYGVATGYSKEIINAAVNFANFESSVDPTAHAYGSQYYGLYQYGTETWKSSLNYYVKTQNIESPVQTTPEKASAELQIAVMYSDLGRWNAGYDQGKIALAYKPGGKLYSVTQTLQQNGIDISTDFLWYAYLRHNTDPMQIIKIETRDFTSLGNDYINNLIDQYFNKAIDNSPKLNLLWIDDNTIAVIKSDSLGNPTNENFQTFSDDSMSLLADTYNALDSGYLSWTLHSSGIINDSTYSLLTVSASAILLSNSSAYGYTPNYSSWQNLSLDPIGAFYDSQSATYDNAVSIADKTGVLVNSQGDKVTVFQLQSLDTNHDNVLSISESSSLRLLMDLNEIGHLDTGELNAVATAIWSVDWSRLTRGNAVMSGYEVAAPTMANMTQSALFYQVQPSVVNLAQPGKVNLIQSVPFSNYRTLRDTDDRYWIDSISWIDWTANQVKINNSNRNILIGTDGNDSFDAGSYSSYASWFPMPLTQVMGGGGDDQVGCSAGNDTIWGGTGKSYEFISCCSLAA
jgi:hypothetical protein